MNGYTEDRATLATHADDPLVIAERRVAREDAVGVLGKRLDALPLKVQERRSFPLGRYCGLVFGLILHAYSGPEVYLEGAATRIAALSKESHGPRAVLNAVQRLASSYDSHCESAQRELTLAQTQLRDHEARLGLPFAHDAYLAELTALRDRLKAALSGGTPEPGAASAPSAHELAAQVTALKATHSIEPAPQRPAKAKATAGEEPVTSRIRQRVGVLPVAITQEEPVSAEAATFLPPAGEQIPAEPSPQPVSEEPAERQPTASFSLHQERFAQDRGRKARQMSLF